MSSELSGMFHYYSMYNEEEVIENISSIKKVMDQTGESYELIFVNDGSQDRLHPL